MIDFCMPSLGADMTSGVLAEWLVKLGDTVHRGDAIAVVETAKGAIEVECFAEGVVAELLYQPSAVQIPVGTVLARLRGANEAVTITPKPPLTAQTASDGAAQRQRISPTARRLATELQVDLTQVVGSGPDGSIQRADIERAHQRTQGVPPESTSAPKGESAPEGMRQAIAAAMTRSNAEIPHYYLSKKINLEPALSWMEQRNQSLPVQQRLLPVALLVCAVASALRHVPEFNGYWVDNQFQPADEIGIGFTVAMKTGGLKLPVIKQDQLAHPEQAMTALRQLISRSRSGQLRLSDMEGASISMTNLGDLGAETVLGVIYPPQVALVGFGSIEDQPWIEDGDVTVKPVITVSLAADHRATDGLVGSRFLDRLNRALQTLEFD